MTANKFKFNKNMKTKIYLNRITIVLFLLIIMACGNKKTDTNTNIEKNVPLVSETNTYSLPQSESPTTDLEKAKKDGKAVFLVITGADESGIEKAASIVKEANNKVKNSLIVRLNKEDAKNSNLVSKFRIAAVPVPFILVISPSGIPVAGAPPSQITSDQLVEVIPSPKQDEVFLAINEKKSVLIVISRAGYSDKKEILANCKKASSKISTKPVIVQIDFDEYNEKNFLKQLGITSIDGKTITIVINSSGQITEMFTEIPQVDILTAAANRIIQNKGCSPGGCAPSGCN